jgi:hypothetical protein
LLGATFKGGEDTWVCEITVCEIIPTQMPNASWSL